MRRLLAIGLALALILLVLAACPPGLLSAQDVYSRHCLAGCPGGSPDSNELVIREIYVLSNNPETKFADWVATESRPRPSDRRRSGCGERTPGCRRG